MCVSGGSDADKGWRAALARNWQEFNPKDILAPLKELCSSKWEACSKEASVPGFTFIRHPYVHYCLLLGKLQKYTNLVVLRLRGVSLRSNVRTTVFGASGSSTSELATMIVYVSSSPSIQG